ncbi:CBS domain-containing protein [Persephonella hydrogeniphila]|uniref:CBS domain-containing protein n=1 Tax=Persephonella hydrogeniphila TaxID=198703 RepID=A0A285NQ06_9AQUI|nr:CBS domain-containing protein [Persephonella hydrogeniphila]SNZ09926.1 CBS domain-containing protein [Persephonella hydrogeniphila]
MLVKDIMKREVCTISPMASIKDALKVMKEKDVKALIVDKQHPHDAYGIITYTSILKAVYAEEGDIELLNVYDIAVKPAISISGEVDIKYAARMMVNFNIKRVLVIENNQLQGIISMTDIIESLFREIGE